MHTEAVLRAAAFGDEPCPPPGLLAVSPGDAPAVRLLAAIVLGARGRYAAAATLLAGLRRDRDPVVASLAASTLASHRRQLGGHTAARALDGEALAAVPQGGPRELDEPDPDGLDAAGARADALLGLAADNLAVGRIPAARRFVARAGERDAGWRAAVRGGWVAAEIELAAGHAEAAIAPARAALDKSTGRGARRHIVKSEIVLAVALGAAGTPDERHFAGLLVSNAAECAEKCELHSLLWPATLVAAGLRPELAEAYRFRSTQVLHAVLRHADACGRRIARDSPWVPAGEG